jgi:hypothetical protein
MRAVKSPMIAGRRKQGEAMVLFHVASRTFLFAQVSQAFLRKF